MAALNREKLLARQIKRREVEIDEGTVWVRELSAAEVGAYLTLKSPEIEKLAWVVTHAACNADGSPMFSDADQASVKGLGFDVVRKLSDAVAELSGLAEKKGETH